MSNGMEIVTELGTFAFKSRADAETFGRRVEADAPSGVIVHEGKEWKLPFKGMRLTFEIYQRETSELLVADYPVGVRVFAHLNTGGGGGVIAS